MFKKVLQKRWTPVAATSARGLLQDLKVAKFSSKVSSLADIQTTTTHSSGSSKSRLLILSALLASVGIYSLKKEVNSEAAKTVNAGKAADWTDGEVKEVKVGEGDKDKIIISKVDGRYYANGFQCTHFGAPMAKGLLVGDKLLCPWHTAAFDVKTGQPEYAPALDALPVYKVTEKDGDLWVELPEKLPFSVTPAMAKRDPANKTRIVIVGSGPAGLSAAETLRQSRFTGEIIMLTEESVVPYDRTMVNKIPMFFDISKQKLRSEEFFIENDIDLRRDSHVASINTDGHSLTLTSGETVKYDKVLLATGTSPIVPSLPGLASSTKNIFSVRNAKDVAGIQAAFKDAKNIVVVGGSFIGLEIAGALKGVAKETKNVTVVEASETPFFRSLGPEVGKALQNLHEENGVTVLTGRTAVELTTNGDSPKSLKLDNGAEVEADVVIFGIGVRPATQWISGVDKAKDTSVICDSYLRTSAKDVFCAGDICQYPDKYVGGPHRVEHWNHAMQMGTYAAFNILERDAEYVTVPFFWTRHWNKSLHYTGVGIPYDEIHIEGEPMKLNFIAYYIKGDKVVSVSAMNRSPDIQIVNQAMRYDVMATGSEIKSGKVTLADIKKRLSTSKQCACERMKYITAEDLKK